ncbi:Ger(x)C family spore germination protein [Virgibacillus kimchii]
MRVCTIFSLLFIFIFLSGCWNSSEIDERALVHGTGIDLNGDTKLLDAYVEIVKPTKQEEGTFQSNENLVLQIDTETPLDGARELIRYAKRRLYFGHNRLWLVGEDLAKEKFAPIFDIIRRDQMNRLNSYIFITRDDIEEVFSTPTLYENLSSDEIVSGLEQSRYTAEFIPVRLYDFINLNEEELNTAYIPIISMNDNVSGPITSIDGTAVINDGRMVGDLTTDETEALTVLLNKAEGGVVPISMIEEREIISMEVKDSNLLVYPTLRGEDLHVDLTLKLVGELGDNIMENPKEITEDFIQEAENLVEEEVERKLRDTLEKLQELQTDITNIGKETYRKYPEEWREIKHVYHEEIFPNATVDFHITADIYHQGLINKSINEPRKKPENNPFPFLN